MAGGWVNRIGGGVAACFAALALLLQIAAPSGYMVAQSGGGAAIVICTGHGPLLSGPAEHGQPGKTPKTGDAGVCVFAGHGGCAPTPPLLVPTPEPVVLVAATAAPARDLQPGRGLAAPPPPSQGPPRLSI